MHIYIRFELADLLDRKIASGLSNMQTLSDMKYDKSVRYGAIKMREYIENFEKNYLSLIMNVRGMLFYTTHIFTCCLIFFCTYAVLVGS
jgi:hypothetical protein